MRVLFRLRNPQLPLAGTADHLRQDLPQFLRCKDKGAWVSHVVLGEGHVIRFWPYFPIEAIEILQEKGLRKLPGAISPKVKEENGVTITNPLLVRVQENERWHEFICRSALILSSYC